ncbi:MAG TPA: hypothetical protein DEP84_36825 [Chloroflexi bacterium]|nr:hypothetical protein [Chloroflexota bacterium]
MSFLLLFAWRLHRNFFEAPKKYYFAVQDYNEVMELMLAVGLFLFMVFQIRRIRTKEQTIPAIPTTVTDSS